MGSKASRLKMIELELQDSAESAAARELLDRATEQRQIKMEVEHRIRRLEKDYQLEDSDVRVTSEQTKAKRAAEQLALFQSRAHELHQNRVLLGLLENARRYLRRVGGPLTPCPAPDIVLDPGSETAALEETRQHIAELVAEQHRVRSAPRPSSEIRALVVAEVDKLVAAGKPDLYPLLEGLGGIEFPKTILHLQAHMKDASGLAVGETVNTTAVLAWALGRDVLMRAFDREVAEISDDTCALSDSEKREQLIALEAQQLESERREEAIVMLMAARNLKVQRRKDVDVRAILEIE